MSNVDEELERPNPGRKPKGDDTPAALYIHCVNVYNAMLRDAKGIVITNDDGEEDTLVMWEGMLTGLIVNKMNLSVPYYTSVTRALKRMGCVRQLKRGGGTAPSQWELLHDPTPELFESALPPRTKRTDKNSLMQEQLTSFNRRLLKIETLMDEIIREAENEDER